MEKVEILRSRTYWSDLKRLLHPLASSTWRALQYQAPLVTFMPQRDGPTFTVLQNDGSLRFDTGMSRLRPGPAIATACPRVVPGSSTSRQWQTHAAGAASTGVAARAQARLDARPSADEELLARLAARKPKRGKGATVWSALGEDTSYGVASVQVFTFYFQVLQLWRMLWLLEWLRAWWANRIPSFHPAPHNDAVQYFVTDTEYRRMRTIWEAERAWASRADVQPMSTLARGERHAWINQMLSTNTMLPNNLALGYDAAARVSWHRWIKAQLAESGAYAVYFKAEHIRAHQRVSEAAAFELLYHYQHFFRLLDSLAEGVKGDE
ncbi:hypothetical protein DFH09DRAFT_1328187 [Mycena vulgaris]|nr:hypothetical protein DFH09DRAFT_1328187 [Mycena vulgaris]